MPVMVGDPLWTAVVRHFGGDARKARQTLALDELPKNAMQGGPRLAGKDAEIDPAENPDVVKGAIKQLFGKLDPAMQLEVVQMLSDMHGGNGGEHPSIAADMARRLRATDAAIRKSGGIPGALPTGVASPEERFGIAR